MKIVLDSNILISALMFDSAKRAIIALSGFEFYYPEESLAELEKYKLEIISRIGINETDYKALRDKILSKVKLIDRDELNPFIHEASDIMDKIDPKDTIFIACALACGGFIWSDDKHFSKQNRIKILKQKDIIDIINSES